MKKRVLLILIICFFMVCFSFGNVFAGKECGYQAIPSSSTIVNPPAMGYYKFEFCGFVECRDCSSQAFWGLEEIYSSSGRCPLPSMPAILKLGYIYTLGDNQVHRTYGATGLEDAYEICREPINGDDICVEEEKCDYTGEYPAEFDVACPSCEEPEEPEPAITNICSSGQIIMKLSSDKNAHGALWDDSDYGYNVCYEDIFPGAYSGLNPHECNDPVNPTNIVMWLNSESNSHAVAPEKGGPSTEYNTPVCYGNLNCHSTQENCGAGEEIVARLYSEENSHISNAGISEFDVKKISGPCILFNNGTIICEDWINSGGMIELDPRINSKPVDIEVAEEGPFYSRNFCVVGESGEAECWNGNDVTAVMRKANNVKKAIYVKDRTIVLKKDGNVYELPEMTNAFYYGEGNAKDLFLSEHNLLILTEEGEIKRFSYPTLEFSSVGVVPDAKKISASGSEGLTVYVLDNKNDLYEFIPSINSKGKKASNVKDIIGSQSTLRCYLTFEGIVICGGSPLWATYINQPSYRGGDAVMVGSYFARSSSGIASGYSILKSDGVFEKHTGFADITTTLASLADTNYPIKICCQKEERVIISDMYWVNEYGVPTNQTSHGRKVNMTAVGAMAEGEEIVWEIWEDDGGSLLDNKVAEGTYTITLEDSNNGWFTINWTARWEVDQSGNPEYFVRVISKNTYDSNVLNDNYGLLGVLPFGDNADPTAVITGPEDGQLYQVGQIISFKHASFDNEGGDLAKATWSFGGSVDVAGTDKSEEVLEGVNVLGEFQASYNSPGYKVIILTVEDDGGAKGADYVVIGVLD